MKAKEISIGVVGLGLMGCSITTCLLMAGHPVIAIAPIPLDLDFAEKRVTDHLTRAMQEGLLKDKPESFLKNLTITSLKSPQMISRKRVVCEGSIQCNPKNLRGYCVCACNILIGMAEV